MPATAFQTRRRAASQSENVPVTAATTAAVEDERGRVVDQALALDHRDEPPRHAEPRAIVVAASGSVGETTAPSTKAAGQVIRR